MHTKIDISDKDSYRSTLAQYLDCARGGRDFVPTGDVDEFPYTEWGRRLTQLAGHEERDHIEERARPPTGTTDAFVREGGPP